MVVDAQIDLALPGGSPRLQPRRISPAWRPRCSPRPRLRRRPGRRAIARRAAPPNARTSRPWTSQTRSLATMFACALKPSPVANPAAGTGRPRRRGPRRGPRGRGWRPDGTRGVVRGHERRERLLGALAGAQEVEAERPRSAGSAYDWVATSADARCAPRHDGARVERPRLDGDARSSPVSGRARRSSTSFAKCRDHSLGVLSARSSPAPAGGCRPRSLAKLSLSCRMRAGRAMNHQWRCSLPSPQRPMCTRPTSSTARTRPLDPLEERPPSSAVSSGQRLDVVVLLRLEDQDDRQARLGRAPSAASARPPRSRSSAALPQAWQSTPPSPARCFSSAAGGCNARGRMSPSNGKVSHSSTGRHPQRVLRAGVELFGRLGQGSGRC